MQKLNEQKKKSFDDLSELNQATQFLHENGMMIKISL